MLILLVFLSIVTKIWGLYTDTNVIELTPVNFETLVLNTDQIWIVKFFTADSNESKALVPEYSKAATALKGIIAIGAIDAGRHTDLKDEYKIKDLPTIKIFGANKKKPGTYRGDKTAMGLAVAALKAAKAKVKPILDSSVSNPTEVNLYDNNFKKKVLNSDEMWMVKFYAPWCGHCKQLEPEWTKAASMLKGKVRFANVDANAQEALGDEYNIDSYPTIKMFPPGKKTKNNAIIYTGPRQADDITEWTLKTYAQYSSRAVQLTNENVYRKKCLKVPLCILAFLPKLEDCNNACRTNYLEILDELGDTYKMNLWGWLWSERGAQTHLEHFINLPDDTPTLAAINFNKTTRAVLHQAFSKEIITKFLSDIDIGSLQAEPLDNKDIKINIVEEWIGYEGKLHEVKEEL